MNLSWFDTLHHLKNPFGISRGTRTSVPALVVKVETGSLSGLGECTVNPYYENSIESWSITLNTEKHFIENLYGKSPHDFIQALQLRIKDPFLLCALDEAYLDLYAQERGVMTSDFLGIQRNSGLISNYTIGLDTIEVMLEKMRANPWPIYKIKLGGTQDLEIIEALRGQSDSKFRVDANAGWSLEQALEFIPKLKVLGVEFVEQPLSADNWEGMKVLYDESVLPLIADESCLVYEDVEKCYGHFHGINIKLMKCGGMQEGLKMLNKAEEMGMTKMMGCMTESSIGISAIAQFSGALDYVDMDGALLIKEDLATGVKLSPKGIKYPDALGNGLRLL